MLNDAYIYDGLRTPFGRHGGKLASIRPDDLANGGAIAVGHPLGASGARLAISVARELKRRQARYAAISLCIGVGQGLAIVIERI